LFIERGKTRQEVMLAKNESALNEPAPAPAPNLSRDTAESLRGVVATGQPSEKDKLALNGANVQPTAGNAPSASFGAAAGGKLAELGTAPADAAAVASAPSVQAETLAQNRARSSLAERAPATRLEVPAESVPSASSIPTPPIAMNDSFKKTGKAEDRTRLALKPSAPGASAIQPTDHLNAREVQDVETVQRFLQVNADTKSVSSSRKVDSGKPVLSSFEVRQSGRDLRVVDADGSIYTGFLETAQVAHETEAVKQAPASAATRRQFGVEIKAQPQKNSLAAGTPSPEQNYFFQVEGTNRSLKQKVVFTGNLMGATNLLSLTPAASSELRKNDLQNTSNSTAPFINSRISGRVMIGTREQRPIDAVPARK
jgi:hypothetical protein